MELIVTIATMSFTVAFALFALAFVFVKPFRQAVITRFQGEAVAAANALKKPLGLLELAIAQMEEQKAKAQEGQVKLLTNLHKVKRQITNLEAKVKEYDTAAKSWGAQGNRAKVQACVAKIQELESQMNPLKQRLEALEEQQTIVAKNIAQLDRSIAENKRKMASFKDRVDTATVVRDIQRTLSEIDTNVGQGLVADAENIVADLESEARAHLDAAKQASAAQAEEDDLLEVNQSPIEETDSRVDAYMA